MSFLCVVGQPICPPVCAKGTVWTVGYGKRACWGLQTTKGDISPAWRCNGMQNKLAKARKIRKLPSTLGLKKFGSKKFLGKKVFQVKQVFFCHL